MSRKLNQTVLGPEPITIRSVLLPDPQEILGALDPPDSAHVSFVVADAIVGGATRSFSAPGFEPYSDRVGKNPDGTETGMPPIDAELPLVVMTPLPPPVVGRPGPVRLAGRTLQDDWGLWLALGATYFPTFWMEEHDPDRLEQNLVWLHDRGVDFVRSLGMVGGASWADRQIDPRSPNYWHVADAALGRLKRNGLRLKLTIFSEANLYFPTQSGRIAFVRQWAAIINRDLSLFQLVEIANEHYSTGLPSVSDVRELGEVLAEESDVLIALSAAKSPDVCSLYNDSAADVATIHYDRNRPGNKWNATRQPWGYPAEYAAQGGCSSNDLPVADNNEPIGIDSSVKEDNDPLRLIMGFVTTFIAGNCSHIVHHGAGIRAGGAADVAQGRKANSWEQEALEPTLTGIAACRALLPADLPNWTKRNAQSSGHPFKGFDTAVETGKLNRSYAAVKGNEAYVAMLGIMTTITGQARWAQTVDVINPYDGTILRTVTLAANASIAFSPRPGRETEGDGLVLRCRW